MCVFVCLELRTTPAHSPVHMKSIVHAFIYVILYSVCVYMCACVCVCVFATKTCSGVRSYQGLRLGFRNGDATRSTTLQAVKPLPTSNQEKGPLGDTRQFLKYSTVHTYSLNSMS